MRTLISNLNVIRATRVSGFLCNGVGRISTFVASLTDKLAEFAWPALAADHREHRDLFWKPLYATVGSHSAGLGSEKRMRFLRQMDQPCPSPSRPWGTPPMTRFAVVSVATSPHTANRMSKGRAVIG